MKKFDNIIKNYAIILSTILLIALLSNFIWLLVLISSQNGRELLFTILKKSYYFIIPFNILAVLIIIFGFYLFFRLTFLENKAYNKKIFIITCLSSILCVFIIYLPLWILLIIRQTKFKNNILQDTVKTNLQI